MVVGMATEFGKAGKAWQEACQAKRGLECVVELQADGRGCGRAWNGRLFGHLGNSLA
jgi:hypothetical protein